MSIKDYKITGTYHYNDRFINITVATAVGVDKAKAYELAKNHDMGSLCYEPSTTHFFHIVNGVTKRADLSYVNYCEELSPRTNVKHELLMGAPLYQLDDYKKISMHALEDYLYKKFKGNKTDKMIIFENLSYGISEITKHEIEWKKIKCCDVCDSYGYVRENIDDQGRNIMHTCYFDCGDPQNIPTLENSMCEYCRDNKASKEFIFTGHPRSGFYCERCELELTDLDREIVEEKKLEDLEYQKYVEEFGVEEPQEPIELFIDDPVIYGSYASYLKYKKEAIGKGIFELN